MKELTSSYDDVHKRMAIFMGIGALLFTSLYLFTQGANLQTYLVRGVLALTLFTTVGWIYGAWLRTLLSKNQDEEELPDNVERQSRDAKSLEGNVINHSDFDSAVIPAEGATGKAVDFTLPELEPFNEQQPPLGWPAPLAATKRSSAERISNLVDDDLPPPPIPSGL